MRYSNNVQNYKSLCLSSPLNFSHRLLKNCAIILINTLQTFVSQLQEKYYEHCFSLMNYGEGSGGVPGNVPR